MSLIGKRMLFWIIVLVIIPLVLLSLIVYYRGKQIVREQLYVTLRVTADSVEGQLLELINNKKDRVRDFSSDGFIRERLKEINKQSGRPDLVNLLNQHLTKNKKPLDNDILDIFIFDNKGRPVSGTNEERLKKGYFEPEYFFNGRQGIGIGTIESRYAKRHFAASMPLTDLSTDDFIGVIVVLFKASTVDNILTGKTAMLRGARTVFGNIADRARISVVDKDETVVSSSAPELVGRRLGTEMVKRTLAGEEVTVGYTGVLGDRRVGASMYLKEPGWAVVVSFSEKEMLAPLNNLTLTALPFIFGGVIVIITITGAFTRSITRRALEASRAANRIAQGNFSERIKINGRKDEFTQFASSFNWMAERLKVAFDALKEKEARVVRLNRFYSVLTRIDEAIVRERDVQKLYDAACRISVKDGLFKAAFVGLVDPGTLSVRPVSLSGPLEGCPCQREISVEEIAEGNGPVSVAIREGRPDIYNDIGKDPRAALWREDALKRGFLATAAFPLSIKGRAVGVICLCAGEAGFFDEENIELLERMTGDISYAIEFIEKEKEHRRAEDEVRLLQSISMSMTEAQDMRSAMAIALEKICETTRWDFAEAWVPTPDGNTLEFGCAHYCSAALKEKEIFKSLSAGFTFDPGAGLPGRVWKSKKPEWVRDVSADSGVYLRAKAAKEAGLKAALAIPIVDNEEALAVLVFYIPEAGGEDERRVNLISAVASQLGSIIRRKQAEESKTKLEAQIRHIQKMEAIGQLTGGIAHDFNNLLTAIIGNSYLIGMKIDKDTFLKPFVEQILATSERASNLTRGLLAFGRSQVLNVQPAALNDIIKSVEKLLIRLIGEDIEFKTKLTDEDIKIMADFGQIEQVLMNLATNARDAMPEGGFLSMETQVVTIDHGFINTHGFGKPGRYALISAADTGTGMDEETKKRIFEPFFTTKEVGKGTGLGLAIVYGIIKQHNGYITVYSEPGKGTTFRIYLPVVEAKIEGIEPGEAFFLAGGNETILLAEDEKEVRGLTKTVLEEFGYKVIEAVDGDDAIIKFIENKDKIQLLILDVVMPKKNGKEAYNAIRNIRSDIKTIFTSGYNEEIIHKSGIIENGLNFISKPFVPIEFLKIIRGILDK